MPRKKQVVECCRSAIEVLLKEHMGLPLFNMREEDFRSSLLQMLRKNISGKVPVTLKNDKDDIEVPMDLACREKAFTSRVHSEVRLIPEKGKGRQTYDIVVLKKQRVEFRVKQSGTDVLEKLALEDVEVVIEIKAAPSNRQHKKFKEDIGKLRNLACAKRMLVVIDKSELHGMPPIGSKKSNLTWREGSREKARGSKDVEVWFHDKKRRPTRKFFGR